ncbi:MULTISPECIES: helix-turn-helix domain-containing protein [unclassified Streptomyces]|uniref:helix-turn-helix domain-containing protein n=1 Tax=unclassified Streptomyces TaxID=2593676 RepID=UPI003817544D
MRLGIELAALRKQQGLTVDQVVDGLDISGSQYRRAENATGALRKNSDLVAVLGRLGVTEEADVNFLLDIHKGSLRRGWWSGFWRTMPSGMAFYVGLEDGAVSLRCWHPTLIFGLLQTEAYARALIELEKPVAETNTETVERGAEVRVQRKQVLTREEPLVLRVILAEAALRNVVGSADVMREQYEEIIRLNRLDHVSIQILPSKAPTYRCAYDFTLMQFPDPLPPVAQMDMIDGGSNITDKQADVWQFSRRFEALRDGALPVGETPNFLKQLSREI